MIRRRPWAAWLALFALALAARLFFVAQYERTHPQAQLPAIDEASYDAWAREIAAGDWMGDEVFFQEPLYAYALGVVYAAAGDEPVAQRAAARRVQAVLGALTALGVALLAARLFGAAAGWIAGAAFALYRPAIWMCAQLLKPGLFLPLLVTFALVLLSTRGLRGRAALARWLLVGVLGGLGALLRGNMLLLAPAFALWPAARERLEGRPLRGALGACAAVALGFALALAPVALRNRAVGGRLVLSTSGAGTNVYGGNNVDNPYGVATEFPWVRGIPEHEAGDWRHEAERRLGRELHPSEVSRYWLAQVGESLRADPLLHARILWRKLRLSLGAYEVPDNHFIEWDARWVPSLAWPVPGFGLWGTLGLAGLLASLVRARREREARGAPLEIAALFALYLATIVLTVTSERVRLALVPLLLPFAASWLVAWRPPRRAALLLATLAAGAALVLTPVLPAERRAADFDERDFNLAVAWLAADRTGPELERLVAELEARHPRSPRVLLLVADLENRRARALLEAGQPGRAADLFGSAFARLELVARQGVPRERFQADLLAGAMLQFSGRWPEAAQRYDLALAFDPADRDLRRRRAVVRAETAMLETDTARRAAELRLALQEIEALRDGDPDPSLARLAEGLRSQLQRL
jgi:4-amino-4-deoxy-L-arabinose transferase-like glycosyltransferase